MGNAVVNLGGKVTNQAGADKVGLTVELYQAATWEAAGAATATTTTDSDGLWAFASQDITKTWIVVAIDGTKKLLLDARNKIQLTEIDLITSLSVNTIYEHTAATGVTIDSVLLKDGGITFTDDALAGIGTGNTARFSWDTTDANANALLLQMPAGGAVDVPVLAIGQSIESVDLGLFNGVVDPTIAIFGIGAVTTGARLRVYKARGTITSPTVVTTGDDLFSLDAYGAVAAGEYVQAARILFEMTGTIATTRGPGVITFQTATDAAPSVLTTALTIDAAQLVTMAAGATLTTGALTLTAGNIVLTLGDIDLSAAVTGTYDIILKDAVADALSIRRATTDMIVFNSSTPLITITPALTVTGLITANGGVTLGGTVTGAANTMTGMGSINGLVITANTGAITTGSWTATVISPVYGGTGIANNVASTITITGAYALTLTISAATGVTLPTTGTLATLGGTETLTAKTLTTPDINGGTADSLTSLSIRSTGAAYDLLIATTAVYTANRTLTINIPTTANAALTLTGDLIRSGAHSLTLTTTAATDVTMPTTGTLATLSGAETFTAKVSYNGLVVTPNTGAITTGSWTATVISPVYGGTGVANNVASTLTISGSYALTLTISAITSVTLPTTGTLITLAGSEVLTNKTLTAPTINGTVVTTGLTLPAFTLGGDITGSDKVLDGIAWIRRLIADSPLLLSSQRVAATPGVAIRVMTYSELNADTARLDITGGVATAVATWASVTHTGLVITSAGLVEGAGTGANGFKIKNPKNAAASALSGTQRDVEIDIGGTPYYFTVYPTKA